MNLGSARQFKLLPYGATINELPVLVRTVLQERQVGYNPFAVVLEGRWGGDHRLESALTTAAYFFNTGSHCFWGAGFAGNGFCCDLVV